MNKIKKLSLITPLSLVPVISVVACQQSGENTQSNQKEIAQLGRAFNYNQEVKLALENIPNQIINDINNAGLFKETLEMKAQDGQLASIYLSAKGANKLSNQMLIPVPINAVNLGYFSKEVKTDQNTLTENQELYVLSKDDKWMLVNFSSPQSYDLKYSITSGEISFKYKIKNTQTNKEVLYQSKIQFGPNTGKIKPEILTLIKNEISKISNIDAQTQYQTYLSLVKSIPQQLLVFRYLIPPKFSEIIDWDQINNLAFFKINLPLELDQLSNDDIVAAWNALLETSKQISKMLEYTIVKLGVEKNQKITKEEFIKQNPKGTVESVMNVIRSLRPSGSSVLGEKELLSIEEVLTNLINKPEELENLTIYDLYNKFINQEDLPEFISNWISWTKNYYALPLLNAILQKIKEK